MKNNIIGRKSEQDTLARIYESRQSEFVAVCGRRRVGKTFLVREYFEQEMVFQTSGLAGGNTQEQLKNFFYTLRRYDRNVTSVPHDWLDAFEMLITYLDSLNGIERKVIFLMNCLGWILQALILSLPWSIFGMDGPLHVATSFSLSAALPLPG